MPQQLNAERILVTPAQLLVISPVAVDLPADILEEICLAATQDVEDVLRRPVIQHDVVAEIHDGQGREYLHMRVTPVLAGSISRVLFEDDNVTAEVASNDIKLLDPNRGILWRSDGWGQEPPWLTGLPIGITGTGGISADATVGVIELDYTGGITRDSQLFAKMTGLAKKRAKWHVDVQKYGALKSETIGRYGYTVPTQRQLGEQDETWRSQVLSSTLTRGAGFA